MVICDIHPWLDVAILLFGNEDMIQNTCCRTAVDLNFPGV